MCVHIPPELKILRARCCRSLPPLEQRRQTLWPVINVCHSRVTSVMVDFYRVQYPARPVPSAISGSCSFFPAMFQGPCQRVREIQLSFHVRLL
jgi:hypothetical protein